MSKAKGYPFHKDPRFDKDRKRQKQLHTLKVIVMYVFCLVIGAGFTNMAILFQITLTEQQMWLFMSVWFMLCTLVYFSAIWIQSLFSTESMDELLKRWAAPTKKTLLNILLDEFKDDCDVNGKVTEIKGCSCEKK
jgi:sterol desaturase/sphingolipid hydroxylase (fatty acid hydroxylase superfamily)